MDINQQLQNKRHSLAHLLAAAVIKLYPGTKRTIGPAIDNGFYYDFEFKEPITEKDLPKIEKEMKKLQKTWSAFERREITADEARDIFKDNPYKLELIDEFSKEGQTLTMYKSSQYFEDLCRGGHAEDMSKIDPESFKLSKVAGAYWRGDEKNKMLTRIYGLAFETKEDLDKYLNMLDEAEKRDHKKLGPALDLFVFSDLVGAGLPLWTPKGTLVRNLLDDYVWSLRKSIGYEKVEIPHITKKELYEKSGHWDKFKNELFRITTREGHEFAMKPMNCPHHTQIYARKLFSYRELPQKYSNTTTCYRDEQTGELSGLSRVRAFAQDDAHEFCRFGQVKQDLGDIWDKVVEPFYGSFGFKLKLRLSLHDPAQPEKYLGGQERWQQAESILRELAKERHVEFVEAPGEAAFYGPKLDFMAMDSLGREWQVATIQLDMNMPERFDLYCIDEQGQHERIVMLHAAIMGSIERFLSILIEHTAGTFPLWLSPVQVAVLPIGDKQIEYARDTINNLRLTINTLRIELDDRAESIGKKIREATLQKIPYQLIIGEKETEAGKVAVRLRDGTNLGQITVKELADKIESEIANKL
ncbi:MAG: threonine--tRNA ligase [Candidatus Doudnabacteria bacterium]|nr:threonine--tRNA ligase [Candidatus Doudnabacteria bacterium]